MSEVQEARRKLAAFYGIAEADVDALIREAQREIAEPLLDALVLAIDVWFHRKRGDLIICNGCGRVQGAGEAGETHALSCSVPNARKAIDAAKETMGIQAPRGGKVAS